MKKCCLNCDFCLPRRLVKNNVIIYVCLKFSDVGDKIPTEDVDKEHLCEDFLEKGTLPDY